MNATVAAECNTAIPAEALDFVDRIASRETLDQYLALTEAYYAPVAEITLDYCEFDPSYGDEQMTLNIVVLPGGRCGSDADIDWMMTTSERFTPQFLTRITPCSFPSVQPAE